MSLFGSSTTNAQAKTVASGISINSSCYGNVVPLAYGTIRGSGNLIWYGDFAATSSGGGSKGKNGGQAYTYSAYFAFALCEGVIGGVANIWANGTIYSWAYCAAHNIGLETGASGQSPWGYLTSKHPGQDLGYSGTAYVYWQPGLFGASPQMQNFAFEIQGIGNGVYGTPDADPAYAITDMLTNASYGVGFPSARLGSLSMFSQYCQASGMVISLFLDTQQDAASTLNDIVQQCNSEFVWSGGQLTIVPYGDQNLSANGASYTAPSAALYSLGDDDFIDTGSGDPVQLSRARPSDRMNSVKLEWLNRLNQYAAEIVEAKDQAAIETYGLRSDQPKQSHQFCSLSAATMSATLQLQRQAVRNQYTFTLGWKYCLLDPMDILEITDANLGLVQQWVRILSIEEDDNGNLAVTAEEYLGGAGGAPLYAYQSGNPFIGNLNASPGAVNQPVILEPPISLLAGDPELVIGVSGSSPYWGSADIYMSTDGGSNYELIGRAVKGSTLGVATASLPVHADPDTADLMTVDISQSYGATLAPASHGTADNYQTSLWICNADYSNGELVGYGLETLTGTGTYKLSDSSGGSIYLRRGQLGTAIALHASGSMVLAVDKNVFTMPIPASLSGVTLYFKFVSYNLWGGAPTDLASATAYTFTPVVSGGSGATGFGGPVGAPSGLSVTPAYDIQNDGTIQPGMDIAWTPTTDVNCTSQEVQWRPHGGSFTSIMVSATADLYFLSGLQAGSSYDFQVRSVRVGVGTIVTQYSAFITDNNVAAIYPPAPAAPTGLTVTAGPSSSPPVPSGYIGVYWTGVSNQNVAGYDVAYNTTNSLSGATLIIPRPGPLNVPTSANPLLIPLAPGTYYVFVRAVDTASQTGTWTSSVSATLASLIAPASCTLTQGYNQQGDGTIQPFIEISWGASTEPLFDQYEVQWDTSADNFANPMGSRAVGPGVSGLSVEPIATGTYKGRVRTARHTTSGAYYSSWTTSSAATVTGKNSYTGGAPSNFTVTPGPLCNLLAWTSPTDTDFDHVQIWSSDTNSFSGAVLWADGIKGGPKTIGSGVNNYNWIDTTPACAANARLGLTQYYWLVPVDRSGNAGSPYPSGGAGVGAVPQRATVLVTAAISAGTGVITTNLPFTLSISSNIVITATGDQSFPSGSGWAMEVKDNSGTVVATVGSVLSSDTGHFVGIQYNSTIQLAAGTYVYQVIWASGGATFNGGFAQVSVLQT